MQSDIMSQGLSQMKGPTKPNLLLLELREKFKKIPDHNLLLHFPRLLASSHLQIVRLELVFAIYP